MIAANNSWCLAYDNLSHVPAWLSDALCRLSTGGGFATRELYTDQEEIIFDSQRPVLLTSIEEVATRSDLLKTFPGEFSYRSWEITPGQILRLPGSVFGSPNVLTVFVFADYLTPGEHRMRVDQLQNGIMIQLAARGFTVQPHKVD